MNNAYDLIIFDMDGTLYDINDLVEANFNLGLNYLIECQHYRSQDALSLFKENDIYPYVSDKAKSTTQLFANLGYDILDWNKYRSIRFPYKLIKKENSSSQEVLLRFKQHCPIVLLTNNTKENVDNVLNHIGININTFDKVYLNSKAKTDLNKKSLMSDVIKEYGVQPNKTLSIGDRYNVDGLPMIQLKGKAIIINKPKSLERILLDYPNFNNCDDYKFYSD